MTSRTTYDYILYVDVVDSSKNELDLNRQIFKMNAFNRILCEILQHSITYDFTKKWNIAYKASTVDDAVFCSRDPTDPFVLSIMLHTQLHGYNEKMSNDLEKIQVRIGISGGETMTATDNDGKTMATWGRDMILAKRIMDKRTTNHILSSEQVAQQVRQLNTGYKFIDMGAWR